MGWWQWIVDNGDGLAGLAAVAAIFLAVWGVIATARDSRARSRPIMLATLTRHPDADGTAILRVSNCGPSVAQDVRVTFDPPVPAGVDTTDLGECIRRRYETAIPVVAPGESLENLWQSFDHGQATINTPDVFTVTFEYRGLGRHSDKFELSLDLLKLETYVSATDNSVKGRLKAIAVNTKGINDQLAKLRQDRSRT